MPRVDRGSPDAGLLAAAQARAARGARPCRSRRPPASAVATVCEVEAMEGFGVLRAAALAGVPGARAARRLERRRRARPRTLADRRGARRCSLAAVRGCSRRSMRELPPPLPPESGRSASWSPRRSAPTATTSGGRCRSGSRSRSSTRFARPPTSACRRWSFWVATPLFALAYVCACSLVLTVPADARPPSRSALLDLAAVPAAPRALHPSRRSPGSRSSGSPCRPRWSSGSASAPRSPAAAQLGTADYVHALGSLATLVIVVGVADADAERAAPTQSDNGQRIALALADLVLSPLLYLGGALLYSTRRRG